VIKLRFTICSAAIRWIALALLMGTVWLGSSGVAPAAEGAKPSVPPRRGGAKAGAKKSVAKPVPKQAVQVEPAKLAMPKVVLSDAHAKTCLVKVGDSIPDLALNDLGGDAQSINSFLGKKLTVIVFWRSDDSYSLEELRDLGPDVDEPYGKKGVAVLAIDEERRAEPVEVGKLVKKLGFSAPVLLDSDGQLLAKVSTRRLPRTYLVDDQGKILWFDLEYSNTTRRDLRDAIRVSLNEES
jgi:peroxiredoxin